MPYDRSSKLLLQETKKGFVARLTAEAGGRDASHRGRANPSLGGKRPGWV
jgi:hypothetical protein